MLVAMPGAFVGMWIGSFVHGIWQTPVQFILAATLGIGSWCLLYLWLLPLMRRRQKDHPVSHDDKPDV